MAALDAHARRRRPDAQRSCLVSDLPPPRNNNDINTGKFSVPVLWDKKTSTIVNNESSEIVRMLNDVSGARGREGGCSRTSQGGERGEREEERKWREGERALC